ncbi:MAG: type II secretion system F family protein [Bryobacteraceae bacterium]|jgi:type IV pilus assembly protein PilC|nr:type II secretion system F family protein [Bryobacteraceae bacterium]
MESRSVAPLPEFLLKYADARGQIRNETAEGASEQELRERFSQQGFLIYSIRPQSGLRAAGKLSFGSKKLDTEKFLVFNQQFVTLIRAGLPILKSLDLLAERLTGGNLQAPVRAVRDEVRTGVGLSDAFEHQGIFPPIYVTSVMAGEKSGSLAEVLERFVSYQRLALSARKKLLLSLLYPSVLVFLVICLIVFLITYVVPSFAVLYNDMQTNLPAATRILIAVGTTAQGYVVGGFVALVAAIAGFRLWSRTDKAKVTLDRIRLRTPLVGEIWVKFQVAQFSRVLSTLLVGGIPLVQALETAGESTSSALLREMLDKARKLVREGQTLSASLTATGIFPPLAIDMIEVGESTGALAAMLNSVAEFFEDDVQTRLTAALSLIEPAIMIFMGVFVAFVLIALYLPIFSLADTLK